LPDCAGVTAGLQTVMLVTVGSQPSQSGCTGRCDHWSKGVVEKHWTRKL